MCAKRAAWIGLWLAGRLFAAAPASAHNLTAGAPVSGSLSRRGEFLCRIPAGGPYQIRVDQRAHDFSITFRAADGRALRTVDAFEYGVEQATVPRTPGELVAIRRSDDSETAAAFTVTLVAINGELVSKTIDAENVSTSARNSRRRADRDSLASAADQWRRAVDAWTVLNQPGEALRAQIALANTLHARNEYGPARELYTEAILRSRELGDRRSLVESFNNRGAGFWQQGDFPHALADWNRAMEIWAQLPAQDGRTGTLINLGLISSQSGAYQDALDYFVAARKSAAELGDRRSQSYILNNLAMTDAALGENEKSAALFESAALSFTRERNPLGAGRALVYSARVYLRIGALDRAAANLARGLPLIERAGERRGLAEAWDLAGQVDVRRGRFASAAQHQRNALSMFRVVGDRRGEANALANLGLTMLAAGDSSAAIEWLTQALALHEKLGTSASEASVMYHLAVAYQRSGDLDQALRISRQAMDRAELVRGSVAAEKLRVSYLASTSDYYWETLDLLMRCADRDHQPALEEEAWQVAERSRARALVDALTASRAQTTTKNVKEQSINERAPDPPDAAQFEREGLAPGDALIEYALGNDVSYAWLIQADGLAAFRLAPKARIEQHARAMIAQMNTREPSDAAGADARFRAAAAALSAEVLAPLVAHVHATRLLIVPDGALAATPFEALPIADGQLLLERFDVVAVPSADALLAVRRSGDRAESAARRVAILADPVFDVRDPRVHAGALAAKVSSAAPFDRLPFSRREALSIASEVAPGSAKLLLGFDAVKDDLFDGALRDYNVIHISTHGTVDLGRPERSALLFSQVDADGAPRDGTLTLDDVYRLHLSVDLVALSACETAFGKEIEGEGAISLSYAFLHAGARRVVASLWRVDDEATAELWALFYRRWLRFPEEPPSAVLRWAQLRLRSSPRWHSPYYWAALVEQGEP